MRQKMKVMMRQDILPLLPVLFALCIVPMIILTHDYNIDFTQFNWFGNSVLKGQIDSFGYAKGVALVISGIAAVFFFCYGCGKSGRKWEISLRETDRRIVILLGTHLVMIILSSVTSKYSDLVYNGGGYSQWQTIWVLLSYGILFFYTYWIVSSEQKVRIMFLGLMIHLTLMAGLGFMQTIGKNPLLWKWVQKLITKYSRVNGITFKEGYSSVLMTFSNPNYCGTFIALMFPIAVSFIFLKISDKKRTAALWKAAGIIIAAALFITMIGSGSSAAGFSILGAGVIALIFLLSGFFHKREKASSEEDKIVQRKRRKKISLAIIGIIIVTVSVVAGISQTSYIKKTTTKIAKGTVDRRNLVSIINESANRMQVNFRNGESFELDVTIGNSHNALFKITDTAGKNIPLSWDTSKKMYTPQDSRFQMLSFEPKRYSLSSGMKDGFALHDVPNDISFIFVYDETSAEWKYYTPYGKLIKLHAVERFGFQNSENVASRRGYIWSRSIPLMKTYWFKGVGPNAFIIAFPNDDFVGSKRIGNKTLLVDKPHNVFLQTYIQTGGISAIAYLLLWILYIIQCVRLFWRTKLSSDLHKIAFGIFISMISYQIVSLTNDAVPGVQSSYWILLGFGFAVNRIIRRKTA